MGHQVLRVFRRLPNGFRSLGPFLVPSSRTEVRSRQAQTLVGIGSLRTEALRTDQDLLYAKDLIRLLVNDLPVGLSSLKFSLSSWFPHRFESEDHAIPWLCPKLIISLK